MVLCPAAAAVRRPPAWACVWLHVYKLSKQNRTPALPAAGCAAAALVSGKAPRLWAWGGVAFRVLAARPARAVVDVDVVSVGDDDTISLFRRTGDE